MKKKFLAMLMALALCATCVYHFEFCSNASDITKEATSENDSAFEAVDALIGYADASTRGVYLAGGNSIINKISSTKVGAGGTTQAAIRCKVSTNAVLEQLDGGSWVRWESWTKTVASGFLATVNESSIVETGHYYRVRCIHHAASDGSTSYTNALWM